MIDRFEQQLAPLARVVDTVLADGLARASRASNWSPYELLESHKDLLELSNDGDACYDRPSSGWAYAAWYHGRRTRCAVELLAPALLGTNEPVTIVDLGSGTGSTLWAVAAIIAAAKSAQIDIPQIDLHAIDSSVPMYEAAQTLWKSVVSNRDLGPAAACFRSKLHLGNWTDLHRYRPKPERRCILVSSYLFDSSDKAQGDPVGALFAYAADQVGATEVLVMAGAQKVGVLDAARRHLHDAGWVPVNQAPSAVNVEWTGRLEAVTEVRRAVYAAIDVRRSTLSAAPVWRDARETPHVVSLRRQLSADQLLPPARWRRLDLDPLQERAANPEGGLTAILGAAGSGKSVVLVERVVRTLSTRANHGPQANMLVTTFNKLLVDQLAMWLRERLTNDPEMPPWEWSASGSQHTFSGPPVMGSPKITIVNWDKLPYDVRSIEQAMRGRGGTGDNARLDAPAVERELRRLGAGPEELTERERRVVDPDFLDAELHRVIYGLGRWKSRDAYLTEPRTGRVRAIGSRQRELVWSVAMEGGVTTWSHRRMSVLGAARAASRRNPAPFTHLFLDECQDMTPADLELATLLVDDPNKIVVTGDETQSLHLGAACRRPGQLTIPEPYQREGQVKHRRWTTHELSGSYRLPVRVCECVLPLAEQIQTSRTERGVDHDVALPRPRKSAVLGVRPVVLAAETAERTLRELLHTYRRLVDAEPRRQQIVTIAEGGLGVESRNLVPRGAKWTVQHRSMRVIKGLERPCVIWPTSAELPTDESELEWIYTILTRSTALTVIVVDPCRIARSGREALGLLRRDRLLFWDESARAAFNEVLAAPTEAPDELWTADDIEPVGLTAPTAAAASDASLTHDASRPLNAGGTKDTDPARPGPLDTYTRTFFDWTADEDADLLRVYRRHLEFPEIAVLHGRRPGAIRKRLEQLGQLRPIL